jgi:RHS repeat-associated protein
VRDGDEIKETRDLSGSVVSKYFGYGQTISGTKYFYTTDHLHSVRDLTDNSGVTQTQYAYSAFGISQRLQGTINSDNQFAGYYQHQPSGLGLAVRRAYNSVTGRWLSRDPLGRRGGTNPYVYVANMPTERRDPKGLQAEGGDPFGWIAGGPLEPGPLCAPSPRGGQNPAPKPKNDTVKNPCPTFDDCKAGDQECCDKNGQKCRDACDATYGNEGYHTDPILYQECLNCCNLKTDACKGNTSHAPFSFTHFRDCLWAGVGGYPGEE